MNQSAAPTFATRLREARETAGLGVREAARQIGVAGPTLVAWERDESRPDAKRPSLDRAVQLARLYNVSLDWLCGLK